MPESNLRKSQNRAPVAFDDRPPVLGVLEYTSMFEYQNFDVVARSEGMIRNGISDPTGSLAVAAHEPSFSFEPQHARAETGSPTPRLTIKNVISSAQPDH